MKYLVEMFVLPLLIISCNEDPDTINNAWADRADSVFSEKRLFLDSNQIFFEGITSVWYSDRKDWCGSRSKIYRLYDKLGNNILTIGTVDNCLIASKKEFDKERHLVNGYKIINRGDTCFDNEAAFLKSDSLLLQTLIPLIKARMKKNAGSPKKDKGNC